MADALPANVMLGANRLIPMAGKTTVAHATREKVLDLLQSVSAAKGEKGGKRCMIMDVSALVWNYDTYAIVGGSPSPVVIQVKDREELLKHVSLEGDTVTASVLVPGPQPTFLPKGATLQKTAAATSDDGAGGGLIDFTFMPKVDVNNDRLELWEQMVTGKKQHLATNRASCAPEAVRNMMRVFDLDKVTCWEMSWGIWECVKLPGGEVDADGFAKFTVNNSEWPPTHAKPPDGSRRSSYRAGQEDEHPDDSPEDLTSAWNGLATSVSTADIKRLLREAQGYYLQGGSTYTMSLFHNMWDKQEGGGHKQLLREQLQAGHLFYMGHSAGAIMSGENILGATWKCIDAFSHSVQPYNAKFVRLPPSETPETFYVSGLSEAERADPDTLLFASRQHMLAKMEQYGGWEGFNVVSALTFPHYDARPSIESFPQSAATYLRGTDELGRFCQLEGTLLVGPTPEKRKEAPDVQRLREGSNAAKKKVMLIANGHSLVLDYGGSEPRHCLSPEEEGVDGVLHWDTYMPVLPDPTYAFYGDGCKKFPAGAISGTAVAGDRSVTKGGYCGGRVVSRLLELGLPSPMVYEKGLWRAE